MAHGLLSARLAGQSPSGQAGQGGVGQPRSGQAPVGVLAVAQQSTEPVDLPGRGGGQLFAGAQQDAQGFPVPVGTRGGQLGGVQTERIQHGQVRVDRVGFALTPAVLAGGLFGLDHQDPHSGGRAGQPGAVAASPFNGQHQP
jgi:hypothetical protein